MGRQISVLQSKNVLQKHVEINFALSGFLLIIYKHCDCSFIVTLDRINGVSLLLITYMFRL